MESWKTLWDSVNLKNPEHTPWETHSVDENLEDYIYNKYNVKNALDVGCSIGTNSSWLQKNGINTIGIDISEKVISVAKELCSDIEWIVGDFTTSTLLKNRKFDLIYDRGCFHGYKSSDSHSFVEKVSELLSPEGEWVSVIGAERGKIISNGPPRKTATEIISVVEKHLEIVELKQCHIKMFDGNEANAWRLISKKKVK